ncbi:hypothetical protein AMECASPLE_036779 [Ameca splendens]|uniref:Uncharacterized protein n=1 Tax=Ameca splendens TaxID=208324 RepID=A0ABV0Y7M6_9TELE
MPFNHAVFPTLLHSGRSYTPTHSNISLRRCSKSFRGSSLIWFLSLLLCPEVDHCLASPDGFTAMFKSSHPCLTKNLPFGELVPPLSISETSSALNPSIEKARSHLSLFIDLLFKHGFLIFLSISQILLTKLDPPSLNQDSA